MDIIKRYCGITRKAFDDPNKARRLIRAGAGLQKFRWKVFPDRSIPKSLQELNHVFFQYLYEPLKYPERSAYVNLFAPCEILHAFGIFPMFVESIATFISGFLCEDLAIDQAESIGISETLCSFHKTFIGAVEKEVLPHPAFALSSSVLCDANTKTFLHIAEKLKLPNYIIDVPYMVSPSATQYVKKQLVEAIDMIEQVIGRKLDIEKLREVLQLENETKASMSRYLDLSSRKAFPNHITLEMSKLMLTHTGIGRKESAAFFEHQVQEMQNAPDRTAKTIFWIQVIPFFDPTLRRTFNYNSDYQLIGMDINYDDLTYMDLNDPLESIAKKMLSHIYNGTFERRIEWLLSLLDRIRPDGAVYFCQWGCKQSTGGASLMLDALKKRGIPCLLLDGDAADRKNMPEGQIKTRFEAFLEMLETTRG
jgi:benzoyl-CoA reductase/2-hydroxyglutaryl-CoA dehydratase subunit BcrC/BadD/HgdB